jgi:hypothetical protein
MLALRAAEPGCTAVLARPYRRQLAANRGVVVVRPANGRLFMAGLTEKPGLDPARALERQHGPENLRLLEGRARLSAAFVRFARDHQPPPGTEPKLALVLSAYADTYPVTVATTTSPVIDLGTRPASRPRPEPGRVKIVVVTGDWCS